MNRLLLIGWQLALRRLGYAGLSSLVLLALGAVTVVWMPQVSRHAEAMRASLAAQASALARQGPPARRPSSGEQLVEFMARFPPLTQCSSDLGAVFAIAGRHNVVLAKGDYQLKTEPNTSLVSYSVTFPVRNEYAALKSFTADVLEAMPHVALDELRMSRADSGSGALDSLVRFTFVYRSP